MMSRSTQIIGLPKGATGFIATNKKMVEGECSMCQGTGRRNTAVVSFYAAEGGLCFYGDVPMTPEGIKEALSDFEDIVPLQRWVLKDGSVVQEETQACPWDSGPMYYLKLVKYPSLQKAEEGEGGETLFEWDDEEIV